VSVRAPDEAATRRSDPSHPDRTVLPGTIDNRITGCDGSNSSVVSKRQARARRGRVAFRSRTPLTRGGRPVRAGDEWTATDSPLASPAAGPYAQGRVDAADDETRDAPRQVRARQGRVEVCPRVDLSGPGRPVRAGTSGCPRAMRPGAQGRVASRVARCGYAQRQARARRGRVVRWHGVLKLWPRHSGKACVRRDEWL